MKNWRGKAFPCARNAGRPAGLAFQYAVVMLLCMGGLLCADAGFAKAAETVQTAVVTRVVDGDTVWVASGDGTLKVRLTGMDAPEICQEGGPQARAALRRRVLGQTVTVVSRHHDDYGRLLARIEFQGEDLGRWMVQQGHAWASGYRNSLGPYAAEQAEAVAGRRGLFASAAPETPRGFRKRHGSCFP